MKQLITILFVMYSLIGFGQNIMPCGTPPAPPNNLFITQQFAKILAADNTTLNVAVVFHIVYNDPADSVLFAGGMNNARIKIQMDILNECYQKRNADTAATVSQFKAVAANAHISYCLNEVRYKKTSVTGYFNINNPALFDAMKLAPTGSPAKDPTHYLNIWVCRLNDCPNPCTGGIGGYAYFPSPNVVGTSVDGVVCHTTYVGGDDRRTGEVAVHEVGHYFNLSHTFDSDTTCVGVTRGAGDYCSDTPPETGAAGGCNLTRPDCRGGLSNNQNWMEYTDCATMFTIQQVARMRATATGVRAALVNSGICSGTPGNIPPTVSIITNGTQFPNPPALITITATANDADGNIVKVDFLQGSTLLSSDASSPYVFSWTNVGQGQYAISAKAYDNGSASATSNVINVTVGTGGNTPTCNLVLPANGANYQSAYVPFQITATGQIIKLEIYQNNVIVSTFVQPIPFVFSYSGVPVGTYAFKAKCYDSNGLSAVSNTNTVTVGTVTNPPPVVSITSPPSGATFIAPASITINATASDNTSIAKVEFYSGSTLINTDLVTPFSYSYPNVPAGSYVLTARAYDSQGASSVSSPVNVTVTGGTVGIPVVKTTIFTNTKQVEFEGNEGTKVRVPY